MKLNEALKFPVNWNYKIITLASHQNTENDICDVLEKNGITSKPNAGNKSKAGKYVTYNVKVTFNSKEEMDKISSELSALACVKVLL